MSRAPQPARRRVGLKVSLRSDFRDERRVKGERCRVWSAGCRASCSVGLGHLSHVPPSSLPALLSPGGGWAVRTWEFSYLCRAGCVLYCVPPWRFPSTVMSLQILAGDCSGGAVLCLPGSLARLAPCPWPFQLLCRPSPAECCEMAGVSSCLRPFPPILSVGAVGGFPAGRLGGRSAPYGPRGRCAGG